VKGAVLAMVLAACAVGAPPVGPDPAAPAPDAAAPELAAGDPCAPVVNGPICADYHARNPTSAWPLLQYPPTCDAGRAPGDCEAFGFDPEVYDPGTWARCCTVDDGGTIR